MLKHIQHEILALAQCQMIGKAAFDLSQRFNRDKRIVPGGFCHFSPSCVLLSDIDTNESNDPPTTMVEPPGNEGLMAASAMASPIAVAEGSWPIASRRSFSRPGALRSSNLGVIVPSIKSPVMTSK